MRGQSCGVGGCQPATAGSSRCRRSTRKLCLRRAHCTRQFSLERVMIPEIGNPITALFASAPAFCRGVGYFFSPVKQRASAFYFSL